MSGSGLGDVQMVGLEATWIRDNGHSGYADYRTKLEGTEQAAAQIDKLTSSLAAAQESLGQAKTTPVSIEKQSRDPRPLYEGNSPIALTQDPKVDLEKKRLHFRSSTVPSSWQLTRCMSSTTGNWRAAALKCTTWSMMVQHEVLLFPSDL